VRIDCHVHPVLPGYLEAAGGVGVLIRRMVVRQFRLPDPTLDGLNQSMDELGIDAAVMSQPSPMPPGEDGIRLARAVNEEFATLIAAFPRRFGAMAMLPLPDLDAALTELAYALDELGLDGVLLPTHASGTYMGDPAFEPLFEELDRRGAYCFVHPIVPPFELPLPHYHPTLFEMSHETTRAIVNLVFSGTLERHRRVRLQFPNLGGTFPSIAERVTMLGENFPEFAERAPDGLLSYLGRVYFDTGIANRMTPLAALLNFVGLDHVVFGTDWPFDTWAADGDPAPGFSGLSPADRARIDSENAAALVPRLAAAV
jgi:predicted TIM-barrel fold metal-dependent hydrolase